MLVWSLWNNFVNLYVCFRSVVPFKAFTNLSVAGKFIAEEKTGKTKMGSALSGAMKETMDDNMKKNQEFMLETQKIQVRQC